MSRKPRVLLIGGEDRNITKEARSLLIITQVEQHKRPRNSVMPDADAIAVLTKFVSNDCYKLARQMAKARKIPLVQCTTGNYLVAKLREWGVLGQNEKQPGMQKKQVGKQTKEKRTKPTSSETSIGISFKEFNDQYFQESLKVVTELLQPGDKMDEDELLKLIAEYVGVPACDLKMLLPEIASSGVIFNTTGTTWKRMGGEDGYEFHEDLVPAPKPKEKGPTILDHAIRMAGLPEGPYASCWAVGGEANRYKEFRKKGGKRFSRAYMPMVARKALELGVLKERDGELWIVRDPEITLKLAEDEEKREVKKEPEKGKLAVKEKPASEPKGGGNEELILRKLAIKPPPLLMSISKVKRQLPEEFWDEQAKEGLITRLIKMELPEVPIPKDRFSSAEWDTLAWEVLENQPLSNIVPRLLDPPEDMSLTCRSCGMTFIFSISDQEAFHRRFGTVTPPRNCRECSRKEREERRL